MSILMKDASKSGRLDPTNGRVRFDGVEFRAVRDLSHLSDKELTRMIRDGVNPKDHKGTLLIGHHFKQIPHRKKGGFIVEIPHTNHTAGNRIQHPLGNKGGIGDAARKDWRSLKRKFNIERAKTEMVRRGKLYE